ncbi:BlaI/MecI/CopY family transcriptional regulator [Glaciecola sp. MH2013]|uniref:BlaI/MecI/CopY family transcriptional regulator n=1 Tax=Glaciecola sp. MH2013 TaxID=2785524 RepID=UPI00189C5B8E|nr:BlaI/MecI/CopY family transcriptional regulator [Glaciecola sp. MH2013]MBF7072102.1 BlaI/MecI/CopY family transcriptional regulator [Glaciecola sp. MH2013]
MSIEISDAEYQIMLAIWESSPVNAKDVIARLDSDWHPKTVNTLLGRLVKKEALAYMKDGRSYLYTPLIEKNSYIKSKSQHFLQKLFNGKLSPLVANFVDQDLVEKDDIEALKKLIDDWESSNNPDGAKGKNSDTNNAEANTNASHSNNK